MGIYLRIRRDVGVLCSSKRQIVRSYTYAIPINNKYGAGAVANGRKNSAVRKDTTAVQPQLIFKVSEPNYEFNSFATEILYDKNRCWRILVIKELGTGQPWHGASVPYRRYNSGFTPLLTTRI